MKIDLNTSYIQFRTYSGDIVYIPCDEYDKDIEDYHNAVSNIKTINMMTTEGIKKSKPFTDIIENCEVGRNWISDTEYFDLLKQRKEYWKNIVLKERTGKTI